VGCWFHYLGRIIIREEVPQALQIKRS